MPGHEDRAGCGEDARLDVVSRSDLRILEWRQEEKKAKVIFQFFEGWRPDQAT